MRPSLVSVLMALLVGLTSTPLQAGLQYLSTELITKELDQINKIVQAKIKESRKSTGDKTVPLKEAVLVVFSRPNNDGMIEKVLSPLRAELDSLDGWEKVIRELAKEAFEVLGNPENVKPKIQITYLVLLDNFITEILLSAAESGFERSLLNEIKDADILISKEAQKERTLNLMKLTPSPSKTAEAFLQKKQQKK